MILASLKKCDVYWHKPRLHEFRRPLLRPRLRELHALNRVKLRVALTLLAKHNGAHAAAIEIARGKRTDTVKTTSTEVDCVRRRSREVGCRSPVNVASEDLLGDRARERARRLAEVRS